MVCKDADLCVDGEEDDDLMRMEILKMIFVVAVAVCEMGTRLPLCYGQRTRCFMYVESV